MVKTVDRPKEQEIIASFLELVGTHYGDFSAINRISRALNDVDTLQDIMTSLSQTSQGREAFANRPLLGKVDLQQLHQLPNHTLGYSYAEHMISNGLVPLPITEGDVTNPLIFLSVHVAETHDIWHVVTGCDTDKPGEVQLEAFCVAQLTPDRLFLSLLAKNLLKTAMYDIELSEQIMDGLTQGWMMGKRAKSLFGIQWNQLWNTPLEKVRESLLIAPISLNVIG